MRSNLELYKIVLEKLETKKTLFICWCAELCFNSEETEQFFNDFYEQRPNETQYIEFFNNPLFRKYGKITTSWFSYDTSKPLDDGFQSDAFQIRIDFLKAIINKLETELK